MTELSQIALEFTRHCMGWKAVIHEADGQFEWFANDADIPTELFFFADLNAVMAAAREWCKQHESAVELSYYGYSTDEWGATAATPYSSESVTHESPCYAIMAACVEAAKKMEAA